MTAISLNGTYVNTKKKLVICSISSLVQPVSFTKITVQKLYLDLDMKIF